MAGQQVVAGMLSPNRGRTSTTVTPADLAEKQARGPEGSIIFLSKASGQSLSLGYVTEADGKTLKYSVDEKGNRHPKKFFRRFKDGVLILKPGASQQIIAERIRKSKGYGVDFFEQSALVAQAKKDKINAALATINEYRNDPDFAAALEVATGAKELALPERGDSAAAKAKRKAEVEG
jgi:hypothetical protein